MKKGKQKKKEIKKNNCEIKKKIKIKITIVLWLFSQKPYNSTTHAWESCSISIHAANIIPRRTLRISVPWLWQKIRDVCTPVYNSGSNHPVAQNDFWAWNPSPYSKTHQDSSKLWIDLDAIEFPIDMSSYNFQRERQSFSN